MLLVIIDHDGTAVDDLSRQAITLGRSVSPDGTVEALVVGSSAAAADAAACAGVSQVHLANMPGLVSYSSAATARAAAELVSSLAPEAVVAGGSLRGNETMAHLGAILDLPVATEVSSMELGSPSRIVRARWAGNLIEHAELDGSPALVTSLAHAFEPTGAGRPVEISEFSPAVEPADLLSQVRGVVGESGGGTSLVDARVIVSGGRGVGGPEGFAVLDELAALLGGTVGCSRVVTSAGWRPHAEQVGQTGTKVAPDLYLACGISGATQHLAGCRNSKTIVVINTDPNAPIMSVADYAIVGDLHSILPAVVTATRQAVSG